MNDIKKIKFTFFYEVQNYITYEIIVQSGMFSGRAVYCNSRDDLQTCVKNLQRIYDLLDGETCIQNYDTGDCIYFSAKQYGQIKVSGDISDYVQFLRFEFLIDQTYLPDIINELKSLLEHS